MFLLLRVPHSSTISYQQQCYSNPPNKVRNFPRSLVTPLALRKVSGIRVTCAGALVQICTHLFLQASFSLILFLCHTVSHFFFTCLCVLRNFHFLSNFEKENVFTCFFWLLNFCFTKDSHTFEIPSKFVKAETSCLHFPLHLSAIIHTNWSASLSLGAALSQCISGLDRHAGILAGGTTLSGVAERGGREGSVKSVTARLADLLRLLSLPRKPRDDHEVSRKTLLCSVGSFLLRRNDTSCSYRGHC